MKSEPSPLRDSNDPRRCGESSPSSDDVEVAGEGPSVARELDTLFQELASSMDEIAALTSKLNAVVTENDALRQNVALL